MHLRTGADYTIHNAPPGFDDLSWDSDKLLHKTAEFHSQHGVLLMAMLHSPSGRDGKH